MIVRSSISLYHWRTIVSLLQASAFPSIQDSNRVIIKSILLQSHLTQELIIIICSPFLSVYMQEINHRNIKIPYINDSAIELPSLKSVLPAAIIQPKDHCYGLQLFEDSQIYYHVWLFIGPSGLSNSLCANIAHGSLDTILTFIMVDLFAESLCEKICLAW